MIFGVGEVKVGHRRYALTPLSHREAQEIEAHGDCSFLRGRIRVDEGLPQDAQAEVLVHEVLHALVEDAGVEWEDEEHIVTVLGRRLAAFIADNAGLVRRLIEVLVPVTMQDYEDCIREGDKVSLVP